ncbi:MAG: hypothetical protein LQ349_004019 [Xanthoria aureola]|nr:MAG: hypothetical protein LQ349_004019 [Xanthoria aureola]
MAPKRGGGSSGGGGSGPSGIEDTPWGATAELPSFFGFGDPYNVARLVFQAIGLIGILAILIAAKTFKKHHELNKKLFKWWAFWLSAVALFVFFAIQFTVSIIYGAADEVQVIFFLIVTIIYESSYLAEISLLLVLYLLLPYCTSHPSRHGDKPRLAKNLKFGHAILLFILLALWLSMLALRIQYQVEQVIGDPYTFRQLLRTTGRISTAYTILYFFGSLEILAWSLLGLIKKRTQHARPTTLLLLALIAAPLLLRSTYVMGATIYESLLRRYGGKRLWLATDIVYNLTTLAIYAGIVAIARHFAKTADPSHASNLPYDPNANWNGASLPPHDGAMKPNMAVHESAPPQHIYPQQAGFQPAPYNNAPPAHGNVQYTALLPPQQQQYQQPYPQQPVYPIQPQQPYPIQPHHQQQQHQQPYQLQGYYTPQSPPFPHQHQQQQGLRSPHSPPQQQMNPVPQPQHRPAPSEVSGVTSSNGLPSPSHTPVPHAR